MSTIAQLIGELETIGSAYTQIKSVQYSLLSDVNVKRVEDYPKMLIDKRVRVVRYDPLRNFKQLRVMLFFFDLYTRQTESNSDDETQQAKLEKIAHEYLREFTTRAQRSGTAVTWAINQPATGEYVDKVFNDRLTQFQVELTIDLQGTCSTGTFNY